MSNINSSFSDDGNRLNPNIDYDSIMNNRMKAHQEDGMGLSLDVELSEKGKHLKAN
jgi:hypothetical protein